MHIRLLCISLTVILSAYSGGDNGMPSSPTAPPTGPDPGSAGMNSVSLVSIDTPAGSLAYGTRVTMTIRYTNTVAGGADIGCRFSTDGVRGIVESAGGAGQQVGLGSGEVTCRAFLSPPTPFDGCPLVPETSHILIGISPPPTNPPCNPNDFGCDSQFGWCPVVVQAIPHRITWFEAD